MACAGAGSFKFLTYQLSTVGYWPTVALTGNGELGFDSGEGARETATTSKDGSRRANCPIATLLRQRREIATSGTSYHGAAMDDI